MMNVSKWWLGLFFLGTLGGCSETIKEIHPPAEVEKKIFCEEPDKHEAPLHDNVVTDFSRWEDDFSVLQLGRPYHLKSGNIPLNEGCVEGLSQTLIHPLARVQKMCTAPNLIWHDNGKVSFRFFERSRLAKTHVLTSAVWKNTMLDKKVFEKACRGNPYIKEISWVGKASVTYSLTPRNPRNFYDYVTRDAEVQKLTVDNLTKLLEIVNRAESQSGGESHYYLDVEVSSTVGDDDFGEYFMPIVRLADRFLNEGQFEPLLKFMTKNFNQIYNEKNWAEMELTSSAPKKPATAEPTHMYFSSDRIK